MFMSVYIVCRVASQGWSRMILYLWSFYSRSYFANYSLPPSSVNIHRSHQALITDYRRARGPRSVTQTGQRGPSLVFTVFSVIRNTKIFVSRCLEATGAQTRPHSPHNATIHPAIYFPAKYDLFELFMIFLFDHKVSFNWARSSSAWQTWQGPSSNSSFYCGPCCYLSPWLPVTRLSSGWTQHVSRLTPGPPGELWPSWNLSGSDWHSGHMDGLTPKKLDPNKMLTQERLDKRFSLEEKSWLTIHQAAVWCNVKMKGRKMSSFKNIFMAREYLMITIHLGKITGKFVMNVLNFNQFRVCKCTISAFADTCIY